MKRYDFASDNTTGLCPEALAAINAANAGACASYGEDAYTQRAADAIRALFGRPCEVFFVFNGTAANAMALAHLCRSHHSVICHKTAHIETSECGAPEFFAPGVKLLALEGPNGKLEPAAIEHALVNRRSVHSSKPHVLSLTLPNEVGVLYSFEELTALRDVAKAHDLCVHIDGARFSNAVAALECEPSAMIEASGADVLCFGGTKAGWSLSEAVVFFNLELAREFEYRCKQAGQLASKMRFSSAPWAAMLEGDHWLRYAKLANERAQTLAAKLRALGIAPLFAVEVNAVFAPLAPHIKEKLRSIGWQFLDSNGAARLMCSWQTSDETIDEFVIDLEQALTA